MCISPNQVWVARDKEWEQTPVACGDCWRCRQNRVNDYVGRCLAEAAVSEAVCVLTLTYAERDDLADKLLLPRHFQLFMKLLRRSGHKVRYLVAGEYGKLKDRAHFHVILFFSAFGPVDEPVSYNWGHLDDPSSSGRFSRRVPSRMCHIREWPHGHVIADWSCSEAAIRYVCKYLLADDKNNAWFSMSKKPALGAAWFAQKAAEAVRLDVMPSTFEYLPPGGERGKPYLMTGATRRDYLTAIREGLPLDRYGRMSEWVQKSDDKVGRAQSRKDRDEYERAHPDALFQRFAAELDARRPPLSTILYKVHKLEQDMASEPTIGYFQFMAKQWGCRDVETFKKYAAECDRRGVWLDGSRKPPARADEPVDYTWLEQYFPRRAGSR